MKNYVFETERLRLRLMTTDDLDTLRPILASEVAMKHYPKVLSDYEILNWISGVLKKYEIDGHSFWMVEVKATGETIGQCGILMQDVEGTSEPEIGYLFNPAFWGNGYATEAAKGCMEYGMRKFGYKRYISLIVPENQPSINVALRNGLALEKTIPYKDLPEVGVYSIKLID
ncbi:GNAT family N-acetyltransferase [bacterium]|nr:GNAT family N-acetyltransferase [bacterium]